MECPACKHSKIVHMKEKAKSWPPSDRHAAMCHCGCGVTREEIVEYHRKQKSKKN